jgi:hypothetical protein
MLGDIPFTETEFFMLTFASITNEAYRLCLDHRNSEVPALHHLVAARNDTAAFQIVLQSDHQYSVLVRPVEYFSRKTAKLRGAHERLRVSVSAPFDVDLNLEGFMTDHDDVEKADVLLAQDVLESRANLPVGVFAEVKVPAAARAGEYMITVRVFLSRYGEDERAVFEAEIPLTVADCILPAPKDWRIYVNLWQHLTSVARHHDIPLWSDAHFAVLKNYVQALAALGQKSVMVCAGEIPWGGQHCAADTEHFANLFEYSIIGITKQRGGSFTYDFSAMQRYIDLCADAGISGDIEVFGLVNVWKCMIDPPLCEDYPESVILRYFDESDGCVKYIRHREDVIAYIRALEEYFIKTGQIDRVCIGADEPADVERYRKSLQLLKEIAPSFRCSAAINHAEFIDEFCDSIETVSPSLTCVNLEYDRLKKYKRENPDKKLLWYVCGFRNIPNNCIINPLTDNRSIGLLTSYLGLDGFLRWNFCLYSEDPRRDIRYSRFGAGNINFVYPAKNGSCLLSLRYKNLQRGFADYELISMLLQKDPMAESLFEKIFDFSKKDLWEFEKRRSIPEADAEQEREDSPISRRWDDYNSLKEEILKRL